MSRGTIELPTLEQMKELAEELGFTMDEAQLAEHRAALVPGIAAYDLVDRMPDELPRVSFPRTPGHRPHPAENPHGAWYWKTRIEGAAEVELAGKTIALKDNICLAGVPMMNGASILEGYVPEIDATVVTRILEAGGTIVGKTVCEYYCFSGGSHTSATGPVHNPRKPGHMAGGSSSGSAAVVAAGEVDMALGGDQGGSVRIPASYCGIVGMKPTHGLVPYTGIMPIERTLDHCGPMTATVADNALLLEVIAGPDGLDPRQYAAPPTEYTSALGRGVAGLRIGVLEEGFDHPNSDPAVDALVRLAAEDLRRLGAEPAPVAIPLHRQGPAIRLPVAAEGATMQMMLGNGFGFSWQGLYLLSLLDKHSQWRERADELSDSLENTMLLGWYMVREHRGRYYAKAQNLVRRLRRAYDEALQDADLLLLPTLPITAPPIPPADAPLELVLKRAFEMLPNTTPFDATHHPALSLPCGHVDGLPVGLMLVGRHFEEATIYRAAHAFEQAVDWRTRTIRGGTGALTFAGATIADRRRLDFGAQRTPVRRRTRRRSGRRGRGSRAARRRSSAERAGPKRPSRPRATSGASSSPRRRAKARTTATRRRSRALARRSAGPLIPRPDNRAGGRSRRCRAVPPRADTRWSGRKGAARGGP